MKEGRPAAGGAPFLFCAQGGPRTGDEKNFGKNAGRPHFFSPPRRRI